MIWKAKRNRIRKPAVRTDSLKRRAVGPERLEQRRLFAADPIHVGVVYIETDYLESDQDVGGDSQGDRFILSFTGGAADTELTELRLITDKDGDGISVGDPIFDTALGGRGKNGAHGFQIVRITSADGRTINAQAEVEDGGQELILRLTNFRAGDRLEFTLDVDEVLRNSADLAVFNDRLDVITSGQEFQDSILEATFNAPHFETAHADAIFLNDYGDPRSDFGLNLPADDSPDTDSRPNRSAAAVANTNQSPKPIDIGGTVWLDSNLDQIRQSGETLLSGVGIALWKQDSSGQYADTGFRATTNDQGEYIFAKSLGLTPGTYRIVETQPADLFSVASLPGTVSGATSGVSQSMDVLSEVNIPLGDTSAIHYDFAEAAPASIGGNVYIDSNNNGVRDAGETGIPGVRIQLVPLSTIAPQSVLTVTTDGNGTYSFTGLAPGSYEVIEVNQPAGLNDGLDSAGTIDGRSVGSAENPGDRLYGITLAGSDAGIEYNFGETPYGSIAGFVYLAGPGQDCNGDHDGNGSTPIAGVEVLLQDDQGTTISRTTTGTNGGYQFDDVPVGNYRIVEFTPTGLLDGGSHVGRINNVTVGTSVDGGLISEITMTPSGVGVEYNFCEAAPATLSGFVYHDADDDGVRDAGEDAIAGANVALVDATGKTVATATTDATGRYEFEGLLPGDYSIVETQPAGYLDGKDTVGTIRGTKVGRDTGADSLASITLKQGDVGVEYNFGELRPASLSGRVHVDLDDDCELDPNEETLAGVTIRLIDSNGEEVARTTTDSEGKYTFIDLEPGTYTVIEEQPEGYFEGGAKPGSAGGTTLDPSRIGSITLTSGEVAVDYDFCERPPAEINGSVFNDVDDDCLFDSDEIGIEGARVELLNSAGEVIAFTLTDASGNYRFTNLPAGEYLVREIQPDGWLQGGQKAGSHGGDDSQQDIISRIPIGWGQRLTEYNFCEHEGAEISGSVYNDRDGDCVFDPDEMGIEGTRVELYNSAGEMIGFTLTDADGNYRFTNLAAGEYVVREIQPEGWLQGGQQAGSHGGDDSQRDVISRIPIGWGQRLTQYNFCELEPASLSGTVYVDSNGDCVHDPDEPALAGVTVELRDASGRYVAQTVTDSMGRYEFDNLAPGQYQIFEQQPDGYYQGGQVPGTGDGEVLGEDLLGVRLGAGQDLVNYDFCELPGSSISGRVWQESDLNQVFDAGEDPISGVVVELLDGDGNVLSRTSTDGQGNYVFDQLAPGVYSVREVQPGGLFHGGQVVGDAGGEVGGDDLLVGIILPGGMNAKNYDFPEVPPAMISGYVFQDGGKLYLTSAPAAEDLREYRDGQLTSDDLLLGNVTLELRNLLGLPFDSGRALSGTYADGPIRVTTDSTGYYEFTGLRPGTYHVYQVQPDDYIDGLDTPGSTGGIAVNPADVVDDADKIVIQTLAASEASNPNDDAILNITLVAGGQSINNNFSEIAIEQGQIPQLEVPTPQPPSVVAPIESFDPRIQLMSFSTPLTYRSPVLAADEWAVTWHLSVINGGFPRGTVGEDGTIQGVSIKSITQDWTQGDQDKGRWTIADQEGKRSQRSDDFTLGLLDATAMAGDFDGDGSDEGVIYKDGQWFVDFNGNGKWDAGDLWMKLGTEMDRPVIGDWDGDGKDDIGIFGRQWARDEFKIQKDPGLPDPDNTRRREVNAETLAQAEDGGGDDRKRLMVRGEEGALRADAVDHVFKYGEQSDTPIAGDWNGDGIDQVAVYRDGKWLLDVDGDGRWTSRDEHVSFGRPGDEPISGDFDGDGIDEIGVVRGDLWIIDTDGDRRITGNDKQIVVPRSSPDSQPVVGDFDGDGKDEPAYYDESA
ncbi:Serine-aspartate repeat-containing protein D precursor [Rubripirellula lacrimiformis]|uniref:Serine-aspartate repeat-containing protein D n=1 Tax=Rubripirellula lacrimiformis TaxID=1930273 RepID=A0A517NER7_9BACT|nr:SdrD B-like domain-containing protein [Rubripirellula lacrimiformis]QDT05620.1 Serine-aspartate repeat-containing protein D precursor [Rubripirellula lacrimiformis]